MNEDLMILFNIKTDDFWSNAKTDLINHFSSSSDGDIGVISIPWQHEDICEHDFNLLLDVDYNGLLAIKLIFNSGKDLTFPISIFSNDDGHVIFPVSIFRGLGILVKFEILFSGHCVFNSITQTDKSAFFRVKIMVHSGIGDCAKLISRHNNLQYLFESSDGIVYWAYGGNSTKSSGWEDLLNKDFFGRNRFFKNVTETDFNQLNCPELFNGYSGNVMLEWDEEFNRKSCGFDLCLSENEELQVSKLMSEGDYHIAIQIRGNDPKKNYSQEKLKAVIDEIIENLPSAKIFLLDSPSVKLDNALLVDARVVNCIGLTNFAQNVKIIKRCHLLIAPDSFSKYIANWSTTRMIILCAHLPYIAPSDMLKDAFDLVGLCHNNKVTLLGIVYDDKLNVSYCCDDVNEIKYDLIVNAALNAIFEWNNT